MAAAQTPERRFNVPLIVAGVVLAIAGFGASVLIGRISQAPAQAPTTATLVVAARDLDARRTIADGDLPTAHSSTAGSLTVAVTQCQAEFLNWFLANATLKYTLLSSSDYPSAAAATPDPGCPAAGSKGVTQADISSRWPGLVG